MTGDLIPALPVGGDVALPSVAPALPALSRRLALRADRMAERAAVPERVAGEVPFRAPPWPASFEERAEAEGLAAAVRGVLAARPGAATVEAWLVRATALLAGGPMGEGRRTWVAAAMDAIGGFPACAFSLESAQAASLRWRYWPNGPDLVAALEAGMVPWRSALAVAEAVLAAPLETGPVREVPRDGADALDVAGLRRPAVEARVVSPAQMVAEYERDAAAAGSGSARLALLYRAQVLRERHNLP